MISWWFRLEHTVFSGDSTNNDGLGVTPQRSGRAKQIIMLSVADLLRSHKSTPVITTDREPQINPESKLAASFTCNDFIYLHCRLFILLKNDKKSTTINHFMLLSKYAHHAHHAHHYFIPPC